MKKMNLFLVGLFATLILLSCSNLDEPELKQPNDLSVSILGKSVAIEKGTLSFENEESLNSLLQEIKKADTDEALKINGFRSMFDLYDEALEEAPLYYETKEGYELFKEKYAPLYFPEYGNDYAAYLPISNKNLAKLTNEEGNIIIRGETISYKDISNYEELAALGWADPDETVLTTRAYSSKEVFYRKAGDNKLWINVRCAAAPSPYSGNTYAFEVCFRDKGFLGAWYNRKASTKIQVGTGTLSYVSQEPSLSSFSRFYQSSINDQFSSHDYNVVSSSLNAGLISFGPWGLDKFYAFSFPAN